MENIEIKVTVREETKKTQVYDFSESIKALEKVQEMSSAIITEVNEKICTFGMQSFEDWVDRLHKELKPVLNNYGVMRLMHKKYSNGINFVCAKFEIFTKELSARDMFVLKLYKGGTPCLVVDLLPDFYSLDFSMSFDPTTDLHRFSERVDFVHKTIMDDVSYVIREAKTEAQQKAKTQVATLENLLNM